jgi:hypothetical protein
MTQNAVPPQFRVYGQRPEEGGKKVRTCKVEGCGLSYPAHSGSICGMCKSPVEHHDEASFQQCLEGRRRMAKARYLADVELDEIDKLSLADG